jgi:hypothetical protein
MRAMARAKALHETRANAIGDRRLYYQIRAASQAIHECAHAVCALANGAHVLKALNGVRCRITLVDTRTVPSIEVWKIISAAGPVATSEFLAPLGLVPDEVSPGDAAGLLGYGGPIQQDMQSTYRSMLTGTSSMPEVARLQANLKAYLNDGISLPAEFQHVGELVEKARTTLAKHRDVHQKLVAALAAKGGVLRKYDIERIWKAALVTA